jgi:hypothetical protein
MGKPRSKGSGKATAKGKARGRGAPTLPPPIEEEYEIDEDDPNAESPSGDEEDGIELNDNSEADEAESGIQDQFAQHENYDEVSTAPKEEQDAGSNTYEFLGRPAIAFFREPDGGIGFALAELDGMHKQWTLMLQLAEFLVDRVGGAGWSGLEEMVKQNPRLSQAELIKFGGGNVSNEKGWVSESLRSTVINIDGAYITAVNFFRDNVSSTKAGRVRATELIRDGISRPEAIQLLQKELGASRTTGIGWYDWAIEDLKSETPK